MKGLEHHYSTKRRYLYALSSIIPIMMLVFALVFTNANKVGSVAGLDVRIIAAPNLCYGRRFHGAFPPL